MTAPNSKKCRMCGRRFTPRTGGQRYCSLKCRKKAKQKINREYYQRQKLVKQREQQEQESGNNFCVMEFETITLPDNHYSGRQPDPYWGF